MFARVVKTKGREYLNIIDGYRDKDGKVKQRVVANLGRVEELKQSSIENLARKLLEIVNSKKRVRDSYIPQIEELDRYNYGYVAYKSIWDRFKLDDIIDTLVKDKSIQYDFKNIVFSLVIDRLLKPKSKFAFFNNKDDYFNINDQLKLHQIYRALDILAENKEQIEQELFKKNKSLFNITTDVVFYDVTTFYYESKNENDLKKFGYSKDGKFGDVQIVMGLLIDKSGLPIGYELFSGNTMDSKTVIATLDKLKVKFNIDTVVIVADRGLNSKLNLKAIKDAGYDYLMASKIKSMSRDIQDKILDKESYTIINDEDSEDGLYSYKVLDYDNEVKYKEEIIDKDGEVTLKNSKIILSEKLVCTYSTKRAKKDMYDRYRALDKANKIIQDNQKSQVTNTRSFKKFIIKDSSSDDCKNFIMSMDWLKIKKQQRYDGYYAITTSKSDLDPMEIIDNYHNLYKIEDSFRVLKSTFNTRPIFHYKESRIEAHFILCFIAFMIERDLEIRLKKSKSFKNITITPDRIKEALNALEVSKIKVDNRTLYMKSNHSNAKDKLKLGKSIMNFLHIKQLKNISDKNEVLELFN
jgi:transposase